MVVVCVFHNYCCGEIMQWLYQQKKIGFIAYRCFFGLVGAVGIVNMLPLSVHQILSLLFICKVHKLLVETLYLSISFSLHLLCNSFHYPRPFLFCLALCPYGCCKGSADAVPAALCNAGRGLHVPADCDRLCSPALHSRGHTDRAAW